MGRHERGLRLAGLTDEGLVEIEQAMADLQRQGKLRDPSPIIVVKRYEEGDLVSARNCRSTGITRLSCNGSYHATTHPDWWIGASQEILTESRYTKIKVWLER